MADSPHSTPLRSRDVLTHFVDSMERAGEHYGFGAEGLWKDVRGEIDSLFEQLEAARIRGDALCNAVEIIEQERDALREALRKIVGEYENATADLDAFEDHGGHVGIARHDRAVLQGLGTCAAIARAVLNPASEPGGAGVSASSAHSRTQLERERVSPPVQKEDE